MNTLQKSVAFALCEGMYNFAEEAVKNKEFNKHTDAMKAFFDGIQPKNVMMTVHEYDDIWVAQFSFDKGATSHSFAVGRLHYDAYVVWSNHTEFSLSDTVEYWERNKDCNPLLNYNCRDHSNNGYPTVDIDQLEKVLHEGTFKVVKIEEQNNKLEIIVKGADDTDSRGIAISATVAHDDKNEYVVEGYSTSISGVSWEAMYLMKDSEVQDDSATYDMIMALLEKMKICEIAKNLDSANTAHNPA